MTDQTTPTDPSAAFAELADRVQRVADEVDDWSAPSPCEGWSAADVIAHLITTERDFLAERGVPLPPAPDVATGPGAAWRDHASLVGELLADPGVADAEYEGFFGPTTIGASFL